MRTNCWLFTLAVALATNVGVSGQPAKTMSVCEALSKRSEYHAQVVRIRGTVRYTEHGFWLSGRDCGRCFESRNIRGPCSIWLTIPDERANVGFVFDREADKRIAFTYRRAVATKKPFELIVTIEGLFETKPDAELVLGVSPANELLVFGFGQGATSPAQLTIKTQSDPAVIPGTGPKPK